MNYKTTIAACYIGNFTQAAVINVTPILFIPLREEFGLSYADFGLLVMVNFISQVLADVLFSKAVDKYGFRPFILTAHLLCAVGFVLFAASPILFPIHIFMGFMLGTVFFSAAGGLLELLLSPIIDMIPGGEKERAMAFLHSFYCWGKIVVIAVTTWAIFLEVPWQLILLGWSLIPVFNFFLFLKVPLWQKRADEVLPIRSIFREKVFWFSMGAIALGAAAEATLSQYTSMFLDQGLGMEKVWGDMIGVCGFTLMMGVGRTIFGIYGGRIDLSKYMILCAVGTAAGFLAISLSASSVIAVTACVVSGLFTAVLWPGTLVTASRQLPLAGASLFALLAAGGDIGASLGAGMTGGIIDFFIKNSFSERMALKIGILCAVFFPVTAVLFYFLLRKTGKENRR